MKIALTGGTGFIGQWVLRNLSDKYEFIVLGRNSEINIYKVDNKEFKYISTDYSIGQLLEQLQSMDAVIHLAAKRSEKKSETFSEYLCNINISSNIFETCKLLNIKNIINLSSIAVYNGENELPWDEGAFIKPMSFYGISKATIENVALYYNNLYNLNIKTLRVAQVLGWGEREGYMLMEFIKRAYNKEILTLYGNGEGRREYIYIKDLVRAIDLGINSKEKKGVFNIGMGVSVSHKELAESINKVFENEKNLLMLTEKLEDKRVNLMNIKKAQKELSWSPLWNLEDALYDMKDNNFESI